MLHLLNIAVLIAIAFYVSLRSQYFKMYSIIHNKALLSNDIICFSDIKMA